jgi:UDP-3-O-[3-hydroxymyristoyl] glucosamine N-acyltransferase
MKVREVVEWMGGEIKGSADAEFAATNSLEAAEAGELSFLTDAKKAGRIGESGATVVICPEGVDAVAGKTLICVKNPKLAFAQLQERLYPRRRASMGISPQAVISASAQIGEGANIYPGVFVGEDVKIGRNVELLPGCYIGDGVTIGDDCWFYSNVSIYAGCVIGHRVTMHSGAVIGADGFGYVPDEKGIIHKVPQVGIAVIEDDVEIGANSTIDRAAIGVTRIGKGTKIDNLVQVGHNVEIGPYCFLCAQVGIAGSAKTGHHVTMAGQAALNGHITVGSGVTVGGQTGVSKDTPDGVMLFGTPAKPMGRMSRIMAVQSKLPELKAQVLELSKRVKELEGKV